MARFRTCWALHCALARCIRLIPLLFTTIARGMCDVRLLPRGCQGRGPRVRRSPLLVPTAFAWVEPAIASRRRVGLTNSRAWKVAVGNPARILLCRGAVSRKPCFTSRSCRPVTARPQGNMFLISSVLTASSSRADRLVAACYDGDLPSVKAAVADGASVNAWATERRLSFTKLPLIAAVYRQHDDVTAWLLSVGADPNDRHVMWAGAVHGSVAALQLLIDAGGDVSRASAGGQAPLIVASANRYGAGSRRFHWVMSRVRCDG